MRVKILHTGDLHVGWENYSRTDPETGLSTCLLAFKNSLDQVVDYTIEHHINFVVIAGDVYKMRDPSQTYQRIIASWLWALNKYGCIVYIVPGNHDLPGNTSKASTVDIFDLSRMATVLDAPIDPAANLLLCPVPWIRRAEIPGVDRMTTAEITQALTDAYLDQIESMANVGTEMDSRILIGHLSAGSAAPGTESGMALGAEPVIPLEVLHRPEFEAVMLGHIHHPQQLSPKVAYCGSLQRLDFSDEDDAKGFCVWEFETDAAPGERLKTCQFVPISARRFQTVRYHYGSDGSVTVGGYTLQDIEPGAIVRVQITGDEHRLKEIDQASFHEQLKHAGWVQINMQPTRALSQAADTASMGAMTPLQALARYCEIKGKTDERTKELMEEAEKILREIEA